MGVNLTTTTTTTVLPCSSYLTAQSSYLVSVGKFRDPTQFSDDLPMTWSAFAATGIAKTWQIKFGQSPECRSFAQAYSKSLYTFSNCGSATRLSVRRYFGTGGTPSVTLRSYLQEFTGGMMNNTMTHVVGLVHWTFRK